jgi:hypothetical protein
MESVFNQVGSELAKANLQVSKAIGVIIGFTHGNQLPVPLYAQHINADRLESDEWDPRGRKVSKENITLLIPTQPPAFSGASGFSGTWAVYPENSGQANHPQCGDKVEYPIGSDNDYFVEGDIKRINHGYAYLVPCKLAQTVVLGEES